MKSETPQPSAAKLIFDPVNGVTCPHCAEVCLFRGGGSKPGWRCTSCRVDMPVEQVAICANRVLEAKDADPVQPSAAPALDVGPIHGRQKSRDKIAYMHGTLCLTALEGQQASDDCALLLAEVARLSAVQITEVQLPDGRPVAAPCGIDGCQYEEVARLRALQETEKELPGLVEEFCGWWRLNRNGSVNAAYDHIDKAVRQFDAALQPFEDVSAAMAKEKK